MDEEDESAVHDLFGRTPSPDPHPSASPPAKYQCKDGSTLTISLPSPHSLWGHVLYPAAICLAEYIENNPQIVRDKKVVEFGAGGGLPSLIACKEGADVVVVTDYPDEPLLKNLENNIKDNFSDAEDLRISVKGLVWGRPTQEFPTNQFDLLILSDLVFNHSQHTALLSSMKSLSHPNSIVLCFFSHHRPHLVQQDLNFLDRAVEAGWTVNKVVEEKKGVAFPEDDEKWKEEKVVREVVHGWQLTPCSSWDPPSS